LGPIYKNRYSGNDEYPASFYDDSFDNFLWGLFKKYKSLNVFLDRDDSSYDENGRFQNLNESKQIDREIKDTLINNNVPFIEFAVNSNTPLEIFNYIKQNNL
jgi:hypothetical protein